MTWTAVASDPENDPLLYKFFLSGPSTGEKLTEKTGWISGNIWAWTTSAKDVGDNQVRVWLRDGKHAGTEGSDSNATADYTINVTAPKPLPKPVQKNVTEAKPPAVNETKPAPTNVTPAINVTPAKPAPAIMNKLPVVSSLIPDKPSPQFAGTVITWTAVASDTENDPLVFKFFLNGPATSNQWKEQTQWASGNVWTWTTSAKDAGNNLVRVWVRDGKHTGPEGSDSNATANYTINATAPAPLPKPVMKNVTEAKPPAVNETKPPAVNQTKPAPTNVTPEINVTPAKPALAPTATIDLPPVANSLLPDKLSPQVPGTSITWTANATDPEKDKILYRFFLNDPSTGASWKPQTDWSESSYWTWTTSKSDVGSDQVRVWVRDGKHAKEDGFDGEQVALFTIKEISRNISGVAFEDKESKPGLTGWTIKLTKPDGSEVSTLTGKDGSYKFENLAPGSYTVSEVLKAGWSATSPAGGSQKVNLATNDVNGVNFGNKATTFSISGKKFNDLNENGVNDGEPGLAGWTINLEQPAGNVIKTMNTAADGTYRFENLSPSETPYIVSEVAQKGWTQTAPSSKTYLVSLKDADVTGKDFGNNAGSWSISGTVFQDLNGNRTGLAGWKIQLSQNGNVLNVTDTAADGSYAFRNLATGTYTLSEVAQNGWVQTLPAGGSHSITLKDADISGKDFVNKGNLSISGMKYYDLNGNGVQDKDEPGIPGQTVTLLENGKEITTTTTGNDGSYTFNNLAQGTYTINDPPSGGFVLTTTSSITVTITTSVVIHASFGLTGTHSISGVKFNDVNGNGVMDSGETGVPGWGMVLDGTTTFFGIHITRTVNTESDGSYSFEHLVPGTYKISELSRPGWTQTLPSGAGSYTVNLAGNDVAGRNFGNRVVTAPGTASIWGMKFNDLDNNGVNNGEPGLPGWTIVLTKGAVTKTTTTNAQGWYSFTNLAPGSYTVSESTQPAWTRTLPVGSGVYTLTLTSGESKVGIDFGNYNPPPINPTLTSFPSSPQKVGTVVTWTASATDPMVIPLSLGSSSGTRTTAFLPTQAT